MTESGCNATPMEIDAPAFHELRAGEVRHGVVDVREPWEVEICGFPEAVTIPLQQLPERLADLPEGDPLVVVCHSGRRSLLAAKFLREHGVAHATSLRGGVEGWALTVDPDMPRY